MLERRLHDGIALRLPEEGDADEIHALVAANRDHLALWLPWAATQTREATLDFIRIVRRQVAENDGMQTVITVDGAIAGMVGLHGINWMHRSTSIGYWLGEGWQGRGAVTATVRAYTEHAFGGWGLERMELRAAVENVRSRAVAERLGFRAEGVLRHAERIGERFLDHVVYARLAGDGPLPTVRAVG